MCGLSILGALLKDFIEELSKAMGDFCGKDSDFMTRYVVNAVLNSIEDAEQESILGMKYHDFVTVSRGIVVERVVSYLNSFSLACRGKPLSDEERSKIERAVWDGRVVDKALCYLYEKGINEDGVPFIVIKDVRPGECWEKLPSQDNIGVRSRFIEIAFYLSRLKQRFRDRSAFEAKTLVSRVFAFNEKRLLPLGRRSVDEVKDLLVDYARTLYSKLCYHLRGLYPGKLSGLRCDDVPETLPGVVREFLVRLKDRYGIERFYDFQVRGLEKILSSIIDVIGQDVERYVTLEAPTGSGKSEVFLIASILASLVRKYVCTRGSLECNSPTAIVVYPRLALSRDQFDRLVGYVLTLNELLEEKGLGDLAITISLNNMEVLSKDMLRPLENEARRELSPGGCARRELKTRYLSATLEVCLDKSGEVYVAYTDEFNLFKCPDKAGREYPRVYFTREPAAILCGNSRLDFIRVLKDDVKSSPGDIHVTLFESLRLNLWAKGWRKLFEDDAGGPIMLVLDEIHTYTSIAGARYSYMLRRLIARVMSSEKRGRTGFVIVGLSATIPNEDFLYRLFHLDERSPARRLERVIPCAEEVVPTGSDYFYVVVPNLKELVDPLSVSIQTIMALHFNMPEVARGSKKTLAFADSLDIVARLRWDLRDAIEARRLQDLRNPLSHDFGITLRDYGDNLSALSSAQLKDLLPKLPELFNSWLDGELWWPYALECAKNVNLCTKGYTRVRAFTSKEREDIEGPGVVTSTSALEVGVDYGDVAVVYQHGAPLNIASLIQRAGRGGRRFYLNPLLRNAIAIQVSPDLPHQAHLLELFMRTKSLREALKYERLQVAVDNEELMKQTMAEVMIDYYARRGRSTRVDDAGRFECVTLPGFIRNHMDDFLRYAARVFSRLAREKVKELTERVLGEIEGLCEEAG